MHTVWQLWPADFHRYTEHLLKLDTDSRYMRFGFHAPDETIIKLGMKIRANSDRHIIFVIENDELEVVAAGHISLEEDKPELAFSVLREHQGQGLGDSLMTRTLEWCRNRAIREGYMVCLPTNDAIKHLARKHGILVHTEQGEARADIELPGPTPVSILNELVHRQFELFSHASKYMGKMTVYPLTIK